MKEEHVTKAMLKWMLSNKWQIICFDLPQSGTGKILHPNGNNEGKNKGAIIPDIVAVKDNVCVFIENKDHFYYPDYVKQNERINGNDYSGAIESLLKDYSVGRIYYGIGLPLQKHKKDSINAAKLMDFIICVDEDKAITVPYNPHNIVFE